MKFITIYHGTGINDTQPQAERRKLTAANHKAMLEMKRKLGDKFRFFSVPGQRPSMSFTIYEVSNPEELRTLFHQLPFLNDGTYEYETYAVAEPTEKMLEASVAADKAVK